MSGPLVRSGSRGLCRGAALTLVFASVLVTAAATGSLPGGEADPSARGVTHGSGGPAGPDGPELRSRSVSSTVDRDDVADAAAEAVADGKSGTEAAEEVVSRSGDRWGAVYDQREYEEFEQALDGSYTGVGLSARRAADGRVAVAGVRTGGPADAAGVRGGDLIRTVDGRPVDGRPVSEVVALLRGDDRDAVPGSAVVLGLQRGDRRWSVTPRRTRLSTEPVTVRRLAERKAATVSGAGTPAVLIKVGSFTRGAGAKVRDAVREAPSGDGILLDLRGNAGGLVGEAVTAASAFLDGGLVATYDVRGEQRALYADPGGDTDRPVVVLVDGGTMSAAELLTGALQDRGRAVTVGSRTFGKGSVQMPSKLPGGSVAELTVGHYRTPGGRSVDEKGITPDVTVTEGAQQRAETVLSGLGGGS
ncbi:S41 family peptidase [Streptomyces sp. DT24]|uniref:S41 family peptidase n=1 Tax=unclassified Streptomyces TaxID=2593676 RepID=UPI0023B9AAC4|nr:S41 family peptidase [Streptomyces sp. AM 4-1-1]WEH33706.1 S41 family peptidase [Streptomyces sp. AM 4-1-1]